LIALNSRTVSAFLVLQNVKQLEDQIIVQGGDALKWDEYVELLFSACSQFNKTNTNACSGQHKVYATDFAYTPTYNDTH
jgi:hypothetical protein